MKLNLHNLRIFLTGLVFFLSIGFVMADCLNEAPGAFESTDGGCKDIASGLVWSDHSTGVQYSFSAGQKYCANLVQNGYTDWRTASVAELESFYQDSMALGQFPSFFISKGDPAMSTWSSELFNKKKAYRVWLNVADPSIRVSVQSISNIYNMLCVR